MKKITISLIVISFLATSFPVNAQITNPLKKLKDKATDRVNDKIDKGLDNSLDKTEDAMDGNKADNTEKTTPDDPAINNETTVTNTTENTTTTVPTLAAYSKFDFIPGSDVLFYEDFSNTAQGDFPANWNTNGSAEVMTTNLYTGNWLKLTSNNTCIWNDSPLPSLPDNFTLEFDVIPQMSDGNSTWTFRMICSDKPDGYDWGGDPGKAGICLSFAYNTFFTAYFSDDRDRIHGMKENITMKADQKYHISIWVQKSRIRVYQDQTKIFDMPKAIDVAVKFNKIRFEDGGPLINNIRLAVGAPDMRSKLLTEGKIISYGIYFDSGKDIVKGESYGSLKEIAAILTENPTVKIKIVGHTDSDGDDALNLTLSQKRAIAVKAALNKDFGIDDSRMENEGKGEGEPVSENTTAEGKAKNRRVEFIKL